MTRLNEVKPKWWALTILDNEPETQFFTTKERALQWQKHFLIDITY